MSCVRSQNLEEVVLQVLVVSREWRCLPQRRVFGVAGVTLGYPAPSSTHPLVRSKARIGPAGR